MELRIRNSQAAPVTHPPPELMGSTPRPVRLKIAGILVMILGTLLPVGALVSAFWLHAQAIRARELREAVTSEGVFVPGTVSSLTRTRGRDVAYIVTYTYAAEGRLYQGRARVRRADWTKLQAGSPVAVRYLPSSPAQSWILGHGPRGVPFWAGPAAATGLLLLTCVPWLNLRRQWMLLAMGRPAIATVTRSKKIHHEHGRHYEVYYEFPILSGAMRSGHSGSTKDLPPGTTLCILYDPDQPTRSAPYPLSLVRPG